MRVQEIRSCWFLRIIDFRSSLAFVEFLPRFFVNGFFQRNFFGFHRFIIWLGQTFLEFNLIETLFFHEMETCQVLDVDGVIFIFILPPVGLIHFWHSEHVHSFKLFEFRRNFSLVHMIIQFHYLFFQITHHFLGLFVCRDIRVFRKFLSHFCNNTLLFYLKKLFHKFYYH